jgi:hypothetical protein
MATVIDPATSTFYLGSGVSVHISNTESDFFQLCPIIPRSINGVGGSTVLAVGIGKIKLVIANISKFAKSLD